MTVLWKNDAQIPTPVGTAVTSANTGDGTHDAIGSTSATGAGNTFVADSTVTFGSDAQSWLMTQGGSNLNIQYANLATGLNDCVDEIAIQIDGTPTTPVTLLRYYTDSAHTAIAFNVQYSNTRHLILGENGQTAATSAAAIAAGTKIDLIFKYHDDTPNATVTAYAYGTLTVLATVTISVVGVYGILSRRFGIGQVSTGIGNVHWGRSQIGDSAMARQDLPANIPPSASAGPDQSVASAAVVTLAGSGSTDSDGTITTYAWTQTGGTAVTLSSTSAANPTFTAPTVGSPVNLTFQLTVTDNGGASSSDTVTITVSPASALSWRNDCAIPATLATAVTSANTGDGTHDAINSGSATGSGNTFVSDNTVLFGTDTRSWLMTQGGASLNVQYINLPAALSNLTDEMALQFDATPTTSVTFLRYYTDTIHSAIAFNAQITTTRKLSLAENGQSTVTSTGTLATGTKYDYVFRYNASTNTATLTAYVYGTTTVQATVTVTVVSSYSIQSVRFGIGQASTGIGNMHWGRRQIGAGALARQDVGNSAPIANAGPDQLNIEPYATVTLNGIASADPDGTIASYAWTQTGGTTVTLSSSSVASPTFTAPATLNGDTLTFSLVVTDNNGATSTADTVAISVAPHTTWIFVPGGVAPCRWSRY